MDRKLTCVYYVLCEEVNWFLSYDNYLNFKLIFVVLQHNSFASYLNLCSSPLLSPHILCRTETSGYMWSNVRICRCCFEQKVQFLLPSEHSFQTNKIKFVPFEINCILYVKKKHKRGWRRRRGKSSNEWGPKLQESAFSASCLFNFQYIINNYEATRTKMEWENLKN